MIEYYEITDSTNIRCRELGEAGAENFSAVVAGTQTAGRGRTGHAWNSENSGGLYFSVLLRPDMEINSVSMITLVMACSICRYLRSQKIDAGIKWPNDIVVNGRKICGILTELHMKQPEVRSRAVAGVYNDRQHSEKTDMKQPEVRSRAVAGVYNDRLQSEKMDLQQCGIYEGTIAGDEFEIRSEVQPQGDLDNRNFYVVVGAGINVNNRAFDDSLKEKATSVYLETGKEWPMDTGEDRIGLVNEISEVLRKDIGRVVDSGSLDPIREEYEGYLVNKGKPVRVLSPGKEYEATALGISNSGALIVKKSDGTVSEVDSGEVSVRGVLGYV